MAARSSPFTKVVSTPGWDRWYANLAKDAWADCLNENGKEKCYGGKHPDVVLAGKAEQLVRSSKGAPDPLFLWLAFNAPHEENGGPPPYMRRDRNKFSRMASGASGRSTATGSARCRRWIGRWAG